MSGLVIVELHWTENGLPRAEVFGPWDRGESGEEHLGPVQEFMTQWSALVPAGNRNRATIALVNDPQQWLADRQAGQEAAG